MILTYNVDSHFLLHSFRSPYIMDSIIYENLIYEMLSTFSVHTIGIGFPLLRKSLYSQAFLLYDGHVPNLG